MKNYPHIRRALAAKLWMVHESKAQEMLAFLEYKLAGGVTAPDKLQSIRATNHAAAARAQKNRANGGAIAVIPIYGMLLHRPLADISGGSIGTSTTVISSALQQAMSDPGVGSIVFDIDSPGGDVDGVDELATEIYQAKKQKKITAVSNCLCASAAYYLASQCSEVVVSPSSLTGSIGVYTLHEDDSAMLDAMGIKMTMIRYGENKGEGNPYEALSDPARDHMQEMVDIYGNAFERAVARGRGIKQDLVHSKFGQGRIFDAKTAVRIGMADRVGALTDVLSAPAPSTSASGRQARFAARPATAASRRRQAEFDKMRYELLAAGSCTVAKPQRKRADDGDACSCECVPCDGGDCDNCDHDDCACEGCDCEMATAAAKQKTRAAAFSRMRHDLAVAGV